jgi:hypothetical protein
MDCGCSAIKKPLPSLNAQRGVDRLKIERYFLRCRSGGESFSATFGGLENPSLGHLYLYPHTPPIESCQTPEIIVRTEMLTVVRTKIFTVDRPTCAPSRGVLVGLG